MKPSIKEKWVEALRSGDYKQTYNVFRIKDRFDVLGVLCDLYLKEKKLEWIEGENSVYAFPGKKSQPIALLPVEVQKWSGLGEFDTISHKDHPTPLTPGFFADMTRLDFKSLADAIEAQL
jgi:hypothetical protein